MSAILPHQAIYATMQHFIETESFNFKYNNIIVVYDLQNYNHSSFAKERWILHDSKGAKQISHVSVQFRVVTLYYVSM